MGVGGQFGSVRLDMSELLKLEREMPGKVKRIVSATGKQVEGKAKIKAPVDTAALRNSILSEMVAEFTAHVGPHVEYAIYQEFGTYKMAAHPFLVPAVEETAAEFEGAMAKVFDK
jgi:HK97 gp10 family phage protein